MKRKLSKGATAAVVAIALTLLATAAVAGTGVGGVFNLGQANTVNATSVLTGSANAPMLKVVNTNTGTSARGIRIETPSNRPPLVVTSTKKVLGLHADLLDGRDARDLGGLAMGEKENLFPVATFSSVLTQTIEAPGDGFVLVTSQVIGRTADSTCTPCVMFARLRHVETGKRGPSLGANLATGAYQSLSPTYVFAVTAGRHTISLETGLYRAGAGNKPGSYNNPVVTAMYTPFSVAAVTAGAS